MKRILTSRLTAAFAVALFALLAVAPLPAEGQGSVESDRAAAEQGDAAAQHDLGVMYMDGRGVEQDDAEAVRWFRLAAEQGHDNAQVDLGFMYYNGRGVEQDDAEAFRWFRLAAEQGHAGAQANLGIMYDFGEVEQDYGEALRWYRLAAEQGHAIAQNNLGWMYEQGEGVARDYGEAVRWYRLAAEQGLAEAQAGLGRMYEEGGGVDRDAGEAARWYRLAAEQGHADAQASLDALYEEARAVLAGDPVPAEGREADPWPGEQVREETGLVESDGLAAGMLLNLSASERRDGPCGAFPSVYDNDELYAQIENACGLVRLNRDGRIIMIRVRNPTGPISSVVDWRFIVSSLTELRELDMNGVRDGADNLTPSIGLTGPIPVELANLTNLRVLSMASHYLSGPIPAAFGLMPNLVGLQLSFNDLTGPIPSALVNIVERRRRLGMVPLRGPPLRGPYFEAQLNNLTGSIPAGLYADVFNPQWGGRELPGGRER